jgi:hypothetical protein
MNAYAESMSLLWTAALRAVGVGIAARPPAGSPSREQCNREARNAGARVGGWVDRVRLAGPR